MIKIVTKQFRVRGIFSDVCVFLYFLNSLSFCSLLVFLFWPLWGSQNIRACYMVKHRVECVSCQKFSCRLKLLSDNLLAALYRGSHGLHANYCQDEVWGKPDEISRNVAGVWIWNNRNVQIRLGQIRGIPP